MYSPGPAYTAAPRERVCSHEERGDYGGGTAQLLPYVASGQSGASGELTELGVIGAWCSPESSSGAHGTPGDAYRTEGKTPALTHGAPSPEQLPGSPVSCSLARCPDQNRLGSASEPARRI